MSIFDKATTKADEGAELELLDPIDYEYTGYRITLRGKDSEAFRKFQRAKNRAQMNKVAKSGRNKIDFTGDEGYDFTTDMLVALTVDWNLKGEGESALPCDDETKREIYTDRRVAWIRDQATDFVEDRANFLSQS
jgi:hypothetical protein